LSELIACANAKPRRWTAAEFFQLLQPSILRPPLRQFFGFCLVVSVVLRRPWGVASIGYSEASICGVRAKNEL